MSFLLRRILKGALLGLLKDIVLTLAAARAKQKLDASDSLSDAEKELVREWIDTTVTEVVTATEES